MAFVLSSISGNLISAASAGFAPTNKADVSAIASAYQVVSATATQLYAGTAYVTSVNGAPLSASRAGQAANASLASSAYYDGTGRLISSLPDSDTVSAIASAYAESAASGKQDELTFGYDDDKISAINGSALAGQGGGGMITSIQSALDPWYQASISGLNGSSLYPKWAESAKSAQTAATADWAWNAQSASAAPTAWASSFITGVSSPSGTIRVLGGTAIESTNSAVIPSTVIEGFYTAYAGGTTVGPNSKLHCVFPTANPSTEIIMPFYYGPGVVLWSSDNGIEGSQEKDHSPETITAQVPNATAVDIWSDSWIEVNSVTASAATQEIGGGVAELAWASAIPTYSYDSEDKISAINGSAIAGGGGGATGDYLSAVNVDSNLTGDGTTASAIGLNTHIALDGTSSYIRLTNSAVAVPTFAQMVSNKTAGMISVSGNKANIQATGKATANFSFNCDTSGQASMLSGPWISTSNWAGVSSYYKNGSAAITVRASGSNNPTITLTGADGISVIYLSSIPYWNAKLDESASAQFQLSGNYLSATESANYQTTADMSGYMPTSLSSDFQQVTGMSSYVPYSSIGYNTASAISGINGSALAGTTYSAGTGIDITDDVISVEAPVDIVAGPGIVIDNPDGNTLRVSQAANYEVALWANSSGSNASAGISLSESPYNFDKLSIQFGDNNGNVSIQEIPMESSPTQFTLLVSHINNAATNVYLKNGRYSLSSSTLTRVSESQITFNGNTVSTVLATDNLKIYRVIGIHRINGGN